MSTTLEVNKKIFSPHAKNDVAVLDQGSVHLFVPLSQRGFDWMRQHTVAENYQWAGRQLMVEHRYSEAIIEAMRDDSISVKSEV
jgi:hypothetical protein